MIKPKLLISVCAVALLAAGCTMAPEYTQPSFPAAKAWNAVPGHTVPAGETLATQMDWKEFFNSQELWLVIGTALQHNKDLKQAALNIEEARSVYRVNRADLLPNINAQGEGAMNRSSDDSSPTGRAQKTELYKANLGLASYELDLFGRIRSGNDAAFNTYLATAEAQAVVRSALIAEVANAYLQLLADQKLVSLTEKTLKAQQSTHEILKKSLANGVATEQDVARARTAVETARVNLLQYTRFVAQDKNALFLLMGTAQDEKLLPKVTLENVRLKENVAAGLPSDVLLQRPDVRGAEYQLLARNADIGAARAAFFPRITLVGTYGAASDQLSNLFAASGGGAWSFLPQVTLPIFQGGRNKANLELAEIRKEKAVVAYEQTVQRAFREVSDELAARATLHEQLKAQRRLVAAAQKVYDISHARYKSGIDSFLSVLDAQRELYIFQQTEIQMERQRLSNLVNLYKVLGGGSKEIITEKKK